MLTEDDVKWDGELPIVLVLDAADEYVCIEQGKGAEERAAIWAGANTSLGPFSFSIHDERCPRCHRTFWHEAPTGSEEKGWRCPLCDALLEQPKPGDDLIVPGLRTLLETLHPNFIEWWVVTTDRKIVAPHYSDGMEIDPSRIVIVWRDEFTTLIQAIPDPGPLPDEEYVPDDLRAQIKAALEGDSNDAEHDALAAVAESLLLQWTAPDA